MRSMIIAAVAFAVAACGGGSDGGELAAGNSEVSSAQIDAALGPADQASFEDAISEQNAQNGVEGDGNSAAASEEDEQ